jgi:hypothetical protein
VNTALICATGPPKKKEGAPGKSALPKLRLAQITSPGAFAQLDQQIKTLRALQAPFGEIFWSLERRIARLTDEIARRGA